MKTHIKNTYYYLMKLICNKFNLSYAQKIPQLTPAETVNARQFLYACYMTFILLIPYSFFILLDQLQSRKFGTPPVLHWYSLFLILAFIVIKSKADKNWNKLIHEEYSSNALAEYFIVFSNVLPPSEAKKMAIKDFVKCIYDYYEQNEITIKGKTFKCIDGIFYKIEGNKKTEIGFSSLCKYASDYRTDNLLK